MNVKRFFKNDLPLANELVMVKVVREEEEFGYYCDLLEYESLEGFLPLSELVKTKYAKKHILKPNQVLPMCINKVEKSTRIVNLTKKRVTNEESDAKKETFRICSDINRLINECFIMYQNSYPSIKKEEGEEGEGGEGEKELPTGLDIDSFMDQTVWPLYELYENDFLKIYQYILINPKSILPLTIFRNPINILANITNRISFTNSVITLDLKLTVYSEDPINKIKNILDLKELLEENANYKIRSLCLTSPLYRIRIEGDTDNFDTIIDQIKEHIENKVKNNNKINLLFLETKVEKKPDYKIKYLTDYTLAKSKDLPLDVSL
ncbi:MAG: translation initiation factor eIF-2 alpha subunit [Barrevirus sp.]|uniref:Translation initiation factor eIF-2 alpha subunit n=1 Tax=Barrevirus sp. TaxID=2487763 RepID=A0A3G4ZPY0_9VIRU|nr:MAG: translation initiation factor eIF-2 alpha subunit [Barrevirus sp.]